MRSLLTFTFVSFFLYGNLSAQQARQYSFARYNTSTGLISNQVNTVAQDKTGYIWIGTTDGLQRFDGIRYKTFRHNKNDSTSIPFNPIVQLLVDQKQNLWILFGNSKIGVFNTQTFTFRETMLTLKDPKSLWAHKRMISDEYGNIFLLLQGWTMLTLNKEKNEFSAAYNFIPFPDSMRIADIAQQPGTKKYWISIQNHGIAIYNRNNNHLNYAGHNPDKEPAVDKMEGVVNPSHLLFDKRGRLWFDTWGPGYPYTYGYDIKKNEWEIEKYEFLAGVRSYYEIHGFLVQHDSTVWIRGLKVFARYLEKEKKFQLVYNGFLNERGIYYDIVNSLLEDAERNIWVATKTNGLFRFNPTGEYFTNVNHLNRVSGLIGDGDVMSFAETRWGTMLVGTWGDGIYHYDKEFNLIPTDIKGFDNKMGPSIWSMYPSKDSNIIWMSAQPGIYVLNQATRSVKFHNPAKLQSRTVRQVVEDKAGNLWLSTQGNGLFKWTVSKNRDLHENGLVKFDSLPPVQVNKIIVDKNGLIWVGTSAEGLYVIDPSSNKIIDHLGKFESGNKKLAEEGISCILQFDDSLMMITTATTINAYNLNKKTISTVGTSDILSGYIASMERDENGYLWVSTTNGLYRINMRSRVFIRFNRDDGIDNDNFLLVSSHKRPDGSMLFGASNEFISFHPASVQLNRGGQGVTITDFRVMNKSLRIDSLLQLKKIVLGPNNNSLSVDFSSLNFTNPYLIKYKLEGLDKNWRTSDNSNQAIYSYLPPGNYTFLLNTVDPEGQPGKNITKLVIKVNPPFWKTWWFYSSLALLGALLLFRFDRERMKRKEAIEKMRTDIADNLHEKVSTALNNINILSEMARLKADKDPQKSKEYIEQIHNKSHNMIIAMDDMLWSIDHENDSMEKTVDRMKEYVAALKNRHGVNIDILVDKKVEALQLNMKLRYEAFLMFKEGIKNLVSTGAKNCQIYIGLEKSKLLFTTQFDNESCNMQELNNLLHRQDLEKRLDSLNAKINVQIHKTHSLISLQIPVS